MALNVHEGKNISLFKNRSSLKLAKKIVLTSAVMFFVVRICHTLISVKFRPLLLINLLGEKKIMKNRSPTVAQQA